MALGLSRKQLTMLTVLVFGAFIAVLNQTVVAPALPTIMGEMSVDAATAQWLTTGFTLVNAIMIPITAFLIDRFTTRRLFLVSMAAFTVGSVLAGWGPTFFVLLFGRLIQAAGAGILMPLVMTVLMLTFPVERRGSAMGIYGVVIAFGPAVGPTAAGLIIDHASWHIMFYIISLLSVVLFAVALFALNHAEAKNTDAKLDVASVVLSSVGFGCLLYGLSTLGSYGVTVVDVPATVAGVAALVVFFRRQLHMEHPMLQVRVLTNRRFLIATIIGMLVQAALLAGTILVPIYLQTYLGHTATESGLVLLPGAIIMGIAGPVAGRLFDKHGPRVLSLLGMGVLTFITFTFVLLGPSTGILVVTLLYTVRLVSLALVNMPITTWGMNALDNSLISHGTSVSNTLRQVAGSLGTAIIVSASTSASAATAPDLGPINSGIFGVDVAFAIAGTLCLAGLVLTIMFVKNRPGDAAKTDPTGEQRTLLESIMKHDVFTLPENATVAEAMELMVNKNISAAPLVNAQGKATGFISDGDIMRFLSKRTEILIDPVVMIMRTVNANSDNEEFARKVDELMGMSAQRISTKGIIGVDAHADLPEVCRVLGENHLKKVPVLDEGHIVGVINRSDITRYSMEKYLEERDVPAASLPEHAGKDAPLPGDGAATASA